MDTFPLPVKAAINDQYSSPSRIAVFGNGYYDSDSDGLNKPDEVWDVECAFATNTARDELQAFLDNHGGWKPFLWQSPRDATPLPYLIVQPVGGTMQRGGGKKPYFYTRQLKFKRIYSKQLMEAIEVGYRKVDAQITVEAPSGGSFAAHDVLGSSAINPSSQILLEDIWLQGQYVTSIKKVFLSRSSTNNIGANSYPVRLYLFNQPFIQSECGAPPKFTEDNLKAAIDLNLSGIHSYTSPYIAIGEILIHNPIRNFGVNNTDAYCCIQTRAGGFSLADGEIFRLEIYLED